MIKKVTERFTETVQDYIKYRPSYPKEVLQTLINECGLTPKSIIADIGSGTGFLAKLFLDNGNEVYGVEPNKEMREAGEEYLKEYKNFRSVNGTAEATTLENKSVDFVTAGTAFHWFDPVKTKQEFKRILKPNGWVLLVWNVRDMNSDLIRDYEELIIKYGTDYKDSNARKFNQTIGEEFFTPNKMYEKFFPYKQQFDWKGFQGRILSASYSLRPGDAKYPEMMHELKTIFDRYQQNGVVEFLYQTKLYYGQLKTN